MPFYRWFILGRYIYFVCMLYELLCYCFLKLSSLIVWFSRSIFVSSIYYVRFFSLHFGDAVCCCCRFSLPHCSGWTYMLSAFGVCFLIFLFVSGPSVSIVTACEKRVFFFFFSSAFFFSLSLSLTFNNFSKFTTSNAE